MSPSTLHTFLSHLVSVLTVVACGMLCLLLIGLWLRSFSWADGGHWQFTNMRNIWLGSHTGRISVALQRADGDVGLVFGSILPSVDPGFLGLDDWFCHFDNVDQIYCVIVPHWFPIVSLAALSAVPWFNWRFSLRTLLIGMTLASLALGAIGWFVT